MKRYIFSWKNIYSTLFCQMERNRRFIFFLNEFSSHSTVHSVLDLHEDEFHINSLNGILLIQLLFKGVLTVSWKLLSFYNDYQNKANLVVLGQIILQRQKTTSQDIIMHYSGTKGFYSTEPPFLAVVADMGCWNSRAVMFLHCHGSGYKKGNGIWYELVKLQS